MTLGREPTGVLHSTSAWSELFLLGWACSAGTNVKRYARAYTQTANGLPQ